VSDLASGGQVFLDATTFRGVKERLSELGAVNHNGLDGKGPDDDEGRRGFLTWFRWVGWVGWLGWVGWVGWVG
jgi:hypothetical protein